MKQYIVKKLYKGHASIRDYIVEDACKKTEGIIVKYLQWKMTIPYEKLKKYFSFHNKKFKSLYNNKKYSLYDFYFMPDGLTVNKVKLCQKF